MSRPALTPAAERGQALVRLKDGRAYQGSVSVVNGAVTVDGRLRVEALTGVTYRRRRRLTVPVRLVDEIRWVSAQISTAAPPEG